MLQLERQEFLLLCLKYSSDPEGMYSNKYSRLGNVCTVEIKYQRGVFW